MTIQEAFKILNLPESSTIEEIEDKYKVLIKEVHPDTINGNHEKASALNNAKDFAIKYLTEMTTNIVLLRQVAELIKVDNSVLLKRQEYKNQSEAIFSKVSRKSVNKYKQMRSMTKLFGVFSAALALVSSNILPIFEKIFKDNPTYSIVFTVITFMTGIYYLMFNTMTERIQDSIDDFKETLEDKANYYDIINSIIIERAVFNRIISRREFEGLIENWLEESRHVVLERLELDLLINKDSLKRIARRIGKSDFSKLIISKGLEKGVLIEVESNDNGFPTIGYSFNK